MTKKYHLKKSARFVQAITPLVVLFFTFTLLHIRETNAVDIPGKLFFLIVNSFFILSVIWRIRTPIIEISDRAVKFNVLPLIQMYSAPWHDIEGIAITEMSTFGQKQSLIKIQFSSEKGTTKEMMVNLKSVEKADEVVAELRERIPEKKSKDIRETVSLQKPIIAKELKYKGWLLNDSGLQKGRINIRWEDINDLQCQGFVIAGYGTITIRYKNSNGIDKSVNVIPSINENYLDVIRYIIKHSHNASIDQGLLKILDYSPSDARTDLVLIPLFAIGIFLLLISLSFLNYYSPSVTTGNIFPFLVVPLALPPLGITLKLMAGRFRGSKAPSSKKIFWASMCSAGPLLAMLVFFIMSPFSLQWFIGDMYNKSGNIEKAEQYYYQALDMYPESMDIFYELGKLYREREEWDRAYEYLLKAYKFDPTYWGPRAVVLAPDTLMKMGRYDEALELCKEVIKDLPNKQNILHAINKKRDEIIRQKKL